MQVSLSLSFLSALLFIVLYYNGYEYEGIPLQVTLFSVTIVIPSIQSIIIYIEQKKNKTPSKTTHKRELDYLLNRLNLEKKEFDKKRSDLEKLINTPCSRDKYQYKYTEKVEIYSDAITHLDHIISIINRF
ncbi:MAG: hypothetical protein B6244_12925 [Candidatus Cloacimonetes bacterium 4572_55]|nr:MAG: hypothetical protein B6244_12925 [Candidatus Cloacimonetes bacterium 4572_55]